MFSEMSHRQRAIIDKMLELPFPGRDELLTQLATALVQVVHPEQDECFEIQVTDGVPARVIGMRPVQLFELDDTGFWTYELCVGMNGIAYRMQAVRAGDDAPFPDLEKLEIRQWPPSSER